MTESVHLFGGSKSLVGIYSAPERPEEIPGLPAAVILNSGLVHRAGPNRLSVRVARTFAGQGLPAFRFDFNGVGDSAARESRTTFAASAIDETVEAMNFLEQRFGARRFVLVGNCSGAVVAVKTAVTDPRVALVVPINIRDYQGESMTPADYERSLLHYYWRVKFSPVSWSRLLSGATDYSGLSRILASLGRKLAFWRRGDGDKRRELLADLHTLIQRSIPVRMIYAQGDMGLDYFKVYLRGALARWPSSGAVRLEVVHGADHLFTLRRNQEALLEYFTRLASNLAAGPAPDRPGD